MTRVRRALLRQRILQRNNITEDVTQPRSRRWQRKKAGAVPDALKTARMFIKELEFNLPIEDILNSGPLTHTTSLPSCNRCIQCLYGIDFTTASRWRKRLGLGRYQGAA